MGLWSMGVMLCSGVTVYQGTVRSILAWPLGTGILKLWGQDWSVLLPALLSLVTADNNYLSLTLPGTGRKAGFGFCFFFPWLHLLLFLSIDNEPKWPVVMIFITSDQCSTTPGCQWTQRVWVWYKITSPSSTYSHQIALGVVNSMCVHEVQYSRSPPLQDWPSRHCASDHFRLLDYKSL